MAQDRREQDQGEAPRRLYHRLVGAAHRARTRFDAESLERVGVTAAQAAALFALEGTPGQTQRQLAVTLRIREPSAAQMIARLEARGLVAREPAAHDARAWAVSLTPAGRQSLRRLRPHLARLNAWLTDGFSPRELAVVARFLDHVGRDPGE
ncbi:MAG: MarR family winged helix-turn-helix transcriptional regulator [Proteobacteria bacterium]|nr:MarR family winged helix-turn-helix transcriptional regulator [Pseudomonadota bacterium]